MKVKLTAKFFFDNGDVKKVDWIEEDPKLKGTVVEDGKTKEVEVVLKTVEDVQKAYRNTFRKYHKEGEVFVLENVFGESYGIPFNKVTFWTLKAMELKEGEDGEAGKSTTDSIVK